jgi:hypothetical protein
MRECMSPRIEEVTRAKLGMSKDEFWSLLRAEREVCPARAPIRAKTLTASAEGEWKRDSTAVTGLAVNLQQRAGLGIAQE